MSTINYKYIGIGIGILISGIISIIYGYNTSLKNSVYKGRAEGTVRANVPAACNLISNKQRTNFSTTNGRTSVSTSNDKTYNCLFDIEFTAQDGKPYVHKVSNPNSKSTFNIGQKINVYYIPEDPTKNTLTSGLGGNHGMALWLQIGGAMLVFIGFIFIVNNIPNNNPENTSQNTSSISITTDYGTFTKN